jgi:hypothetical protein
MLEKKLKQVEIEFDETLILKIFTKKVSVFSIAFLSFLSLVCFLIPLAITIGVLASGNNFHFIIAILYVLFWVVGYFLFRSLLWNYIGKEVFSISNEKISYYSDYKYFKSNFEEINNENIEININEIIDGKQKYGLLEFISNDTKIESILYVDFEELMKVKKQIDSYIQNFKQNIPQDN